MGFSVKTSKSKICNLTQTPIIGVGTVCGSKILCLLSFKSYFRLSSRRNQNSKTIFWTIMFSTEIFWSFTSPINNKTPLCHPWAFSFLCDWTFLKVFWRTNFTCHKCSKWKPVVCNQIRQCICISQGKAHKLHNHVPYVFFSSLLGAWIWLLTWINSIWLRQTFSNERRLLLSNSHSPAVLIQHLGQRVFSL